MIQREQKIYLNNHDWNVLESTDSVFRIEPNRKNWQGFGESRILSNGIILGRSDVIIPTEASEPPMYFKCHIGFDIILNASFSLDFHDIDQCLNLSQNQIWRREGAFGYVGTNWQANSSHRVVTIDFTPELLSRWAEDFALPNWLQVSGNPIKSLSNVQSSSLILARAQQILHQSTATLTDILSLESMVLQLCANSVESSAIQKRTIITAKIDDVLDIICDEYMQSLTITELALRVGMNECYLKRDFKNRTGDTIANFIRNLRMQEAMRLLLDEQKTLKETAFFIGYKDPAYFSRVFKNHFGMSPKLLITS